MSLSIPSCLMNQALPIYISFAFLVGNALVLWIILALNRRVSITSNQPVTSPQKATAPDSLNASDILGWEFEYARTTASEAMRDRHTMINYYLLVAGIVTSGVVAILNPDEQGTHLPAAIGTVLLWALCGIGWLYFLKLIRLRQAWHDSAQAMNQIKDFYIQHAGGFDQDVMRNVFRWQHQTLPAPGKPWTVFFYSAMLIGFLDSLAYVAGGALTADWQSLYPWTWGILILFGLVFFFFHVWLYFAFLRS